MSERIALLIPGRQLGPHVPLLMYGGQAAARRNARVQPMYWNPPIDGRAAELGPWVHSEVDSMLGKIAGVVPDATPLLIGKSLACLAAPIAGERGLPAIWLTPLLTLDEVRAALSKATAPVLLIGGTADEVWDGDAARDLTPYVTEIEGADHAMFVPGPMADSAAVLGRVVTAIEEFLDTVAWPAS